ncbi:BQ2448_1818 [Microbotryum intermedium]|uniref:BQ2448_1818 protein n=1 Tax=Microbotryum intermedium TaxID=269621 RepID=A0A238FEX1_9BASI|nr:BQ2448_1818 [Microbotryum intermedium]
MSTQAPAIGGATTSNVAAGSTRAVHSSLSSSSQPSQSQKASAWQPYSILPPATRHKIDPHSTIPSKPYLESLNIPDDVARERIANKYLQLEPSEGKESDRRKAELATRRAEKDKRTIAKIRRGGCGLVGKARRRKLGKAVDERIRYDSVVPLHHLWLGYMSELLGIRLDAPPINALTVQETEVTTTTKTSQTLQKTTLYPMFPPRQNDGPPTSELNINVVALHSKLVKAEFVGSILAVKRAKNPSLVGINGIVLQETQGTFKLVTATSQIKLVPKQGSVFNITLPLAAKDDSDTSSQKLSFDLFGDQFAYRSAERVGKKWKAGTCAGEVQL